MANASCVAWEVSGTTTDPLETVIVWLGTTCREASGAWSGIRSTTTLTRPLPASQACDDRPLKVTDAGPVKPLESPTMATARRAPLSMDAEIAVLPIWPDVDTSVPVMSAYERITH